MSCPRWLLTTCVWIAAILMATQVWAGGRPYNKPGWVVASSDCSVITEPRVRLDFYGLVDLVEKDADTTYFLLPNTQHSDGLNLPVESLPFASHDARLIYPTVAKQYVNPKLTSGDYGDGWSYVELAGWHVTLDLESASPALRPNRVTVTGTSPSVNDRCSLNWLPWMDDLTTRWPEGTGDFDATAFMDPLPGGMSRLLTSRVVLSLPNEADVFLGSFHSKDGGMKPCDASIGPQLKALPSSIGIVMPVGAAAYDVLFRDIADENAPPVKLTLTAPTGGEQQLYVSHHPYSMARNDFMAHYGLRTTPPRGTGYYALPCFHAPFPVPTCCADPGPSDNPQCSPAQHETP